MDRKFYAIFNPDSCMPFIFSNRKEAEKAQKILNEKYPDEEWRIFEENYRTADDIKNHLYENKDILEYKNLAAIF